MNESVIYSYMTVAAKQTSTVNLKTANYAIIHAYHTIYLYILYVIFFDCKLLM